MQPIICLVTGELRYPYAYPAVVIDREDPKGRHRVRAAIRGFLPEGTQWAYPLTAGGGSPQRGGHVVPDVGADVVIWFLGGDIERPVYQCFNWSERKGESELPTSMRDAGTDAHLVQAMEIGRYLLTIDERPGSPGLSIVDKLTGDSLAFDAKTLSVQLKATTILNLIADGIVNIEGSQVQINGRLVTPTGKGI